MTALIRAGSVWHRYCVPSAEYNVANHAGTALAVPGPLWQTAVSGCAERTVKAMRWSRSKARRWLLVCGVAIAIVTAVLCMSLSRDPLLTDIARPVLAIDPGRAMDGYPKVGVYWLTSNKLLIITTEDSGSSGTTSWKGHADQFELSSRATNRLPGLTHLLNRRGSSGWGHPLFFEASPSGTRLSWVSHRVAASPAPAIGGAICRLDGGQLRELPMTDGPPNFWADDQHYVQESTGPGQRKYFMIRDARDPHADRLLAASDVDATTPVAQFGEDRPYFSRLDDSYDGSVGLIRQWFDTNSGKVVSRTDILPLPANTTQSRMPEDTHQSTTILVLRQIDTPRVQAWVHRFLRFVPVVPVVTEGLWVKRTGSHPMQKVGSVPAPVYMYKRRGPPQIEQLMWSPDGKQVSFIVHGMLYIMPIDPAK